MPHKRGIPGHQTTGWKLYYALKLISLKNSKNKKFSWSYSQIANCIGVWSRTTIWNWAHKDMSKRARWSRLHQRGKTKLFENKKTEWIIAGWIVSRHLRHLPTTTSHLKVFLKEAMEVTPTQSW